MAKIRVYDLARTLNMTSKDLLAKLNELGHEVKSHMSFLEDEATARVKQTLFGAQEKSEDAVVEQKRIKKNVIRKRKQPVKDQPIEVVADETSDALPEEPAKQKKKVAKALKTKEETPEIDEASVAAVDEPPKKGEKEAASAEETVETPAVEAAEATEVAPAPKGKVKKSSAAKIIRFVEPPPKQKVTKPVPKSKKVGRPPGKSTGAAPEADFTPAPGATEKEAGASFRKGKKKKKKGARAETPQEESQVKKKVSKRKEIIEGGSLYDRPRRRSGKRGRRKTKIAGGAKTQITTPKAIKRRIRIDESIMISEFAQRMGVKAGEIISKLMALGVMATVNQAVDFDSALLVATDFDFEVERASGSEEEILKVDVSDTDPEKMQHRPPVVTIMGHVDHGKTSLLDVIRQSSVAEGEAGGITQHIGAYKVETERGQVVFLDTPGHEAFTAMRARGAQATDIVVLVVAADDGVKPQTIEAINHAQAAGVPIIVAVNKIDKDNADIERTKREVSENGLVPEDWGGDTIFVDVSAKQKQGIAELLDMLLLQSEMLELKANPDRPARGLVIESRLDPTRGTLATVLIQEGTLTAGEAVVCGIHHGKVRALLNDKGQPLDKAGPSTPVEVLGLSGVPSAGDEFVSIGDGKNAKIVSQNRTDKQRKKDLARASQVSLENFFEKMQADDISALNLIIKTDVNGSSEAIEDALNKYSSDEVRVNVIHSGVGSIIESDIALASASGAIVLGFNVRAVAKVKALAIEENVDIRFYEVIYDLIDDIKEALTGMMSSTYEERTLGRAEVRDLFVIPKKGTIAGSIVTEGKIERGQQARLMRDGVIIYNGVVTSLRHFKDDVKEVKKGVECGIGIENYNDVKVNDVIECYYYEEIKPVLE